MKLTALLVAKNEQELIGLCLEHILSFCDQIVVVDNGSTDNTKEIAKSYGVEVYDYPETQQMSDVRNFSLSKATGDWIMQIDADELYPASEMKKIREFIETTDAISARVNYKNLAWREGYAQKDFGHYPDRLYRKDVIDAYYGVLPIDEIRIKREFLNFPNKTKGNLVLEYDNPADESFIHPRQPILDVTYYHLARTRGHAFEYEKWQNYNKNMHPDWDNEQIERVTRSNQWVNGQYEMEKIQVPEGIPTKTIPDPKVSVVTTCYNKAPFIAETIESILNQTYKPHEIIVVNDGSTDNSLEIIQRYPVTIISQPNQGVSRARNNGLEKITGDYFVLVDGDDVLKPDFIEKCLAEMKGDVQIVSTDFEGLGEWAGRTHQYPHPFDKENLKTGQVFPSVMALYDARVLSPYGNFGNFMAEDAHWFLELIFKRGYNAVHIPEPLCYYRRTIGSRVDQTDLRHDEAMAEINNHFKEYGVNYA